MPQRTQTTNTTGQEGSYWDKQVAIADEWKDEGAGSFFRIEATVKNGKQYVTIREWFLDRQDKEYPTKKGITVPAGVIELLTAAALQAGKHSFGKLSAVNVTEAEASKPSAKRGAKPAQAPVTVTTADDRLNAMEQAIASIAAMLQKPAVL